MKVGLFLAVAAVAGAAPLDLPPEPPASRTGIAADLQRVLGFLGQEMRAQVVQGRPDWADSDHAFNPLSYEAGVIYRGMLSAAQATGDRRFSDFTARQFQFIADALPIYQAEAQGKGVAGSRFRSVLAPASLDDCGSMAAALLTARREGIGPDLSSVTGRWLGYIAHGQFRLPDGTLARQRPQPQSLWADDMYMSIPALAAMGRATGDAVWYADAIRNAKQMSARLFRPEVGLYAHGWFADSPAAPPVYWGRANGWAMLALEALLDDVPEGQPGRDEALSYLRQQIRGVAFLQSGDGRWHQLLDREDSYLETSCSAMFVYGIAHAINRGWISPAIYGGIAAEGWKAVARQIGPRGEVQNTCIGTTLASSVVYYYHRPVSPYAMHGYGPVLLAGAEMIRLLENPSIAIVTRSTTDFIPRTAPR